MSTFYAAALPEQIQFDSLVFTDISQQSLTFEWMQPLIDEATMLPIDSYRVYWDAGYLLEDNYVLLSEITAYDHYFYKTDDDLIAGTFY